MSNTLIEQTIEALNQAKTELARVETDYKRLRAEVAVHETNLQRLRALAEGKFDALVKSSGMYTLEEDDDEGEDEDAESPEVRRNTQELKELAYEYFQTHPMLVQTPKGLVLWLVNTKKWSATGLKPRVSNLLRKIVKEEAWLQRAGHGKYQYKPQAR